MNIFLNQAAFPTEAITRPVFESFSPTDKKAGQHMPRCDRDFPEEDVGEK